MIIPTCVIYTFNLAGCGYYQSLDFNTVGGGGGFKVIPDFDQSLNPKITPLPRRILSEDRDATKKTVKNVRRALGEFHIGMAGHLRAVKNSPVADVSHNSRR